MTVPAAAANATKKVTAGAAIAASAFLAAAAADNRLEILCDNVSDDDSDSDGGGDGGEDGAQTSDALLTLSKGDSSSGGEAGPATSSSDSGREAPVGVLMAVRIMVGTDQNASFFTAVGLSGMGSGVIDTFLFIR